MKKTIKRILASLMVVVMVLTAAPLSGFVGLELPNIFDIFASAETYNGTCGDNLTWTYDELTDKLSITGTGAMYNYSSYNRPWESYEDDIKSVVIGNGVTTIGKFAFRDCESLTSVTIPDSVTTIGNDAFYGCESLTSVKIPDSVTTIGEYVFYNCYSLTSVTIPDSVTTIGRFAFSKCGLTRITIPNSVTYIDAGAFASTGLKEVTIPDSVTGIDVSAFAYCDSLTSVKIGNSVKFIDGDAFFRCDSLTSVTIPDSVTTIGPYAFAVCTSLTDVYYGGTREQWNNISIDSYNDDLLNATIHFNSTGPDNPNPDNPNPDDGKDVIEFGSYPQSQVTDSALLAELNSISLNLKQFSDSVVKYADVTYGGEKYRAVTFTKYRPRRTDIEGSAENSAQDDNGYYINEVYWFKYEPLKWRVLDPDEGFIMCESLIDAQAYNDVVFKNSADGKYYQDSHYKNYANNYATSSIRDWLNEDFYNTAFTPEEQEKIKPSKQVTKSSDPNYPEYNSKSTKDKLFLVSMEEVKNSDYGFTGTTSDPQRQAVGSDYAKCQGLEVSTTYSEGFSEWWLRTPNMNSYYATVAEIQPRYTGVKVETTSVGVRPALKFNPSEDIDLVIAEDYEDVQLDHYDKDGMGDWLGTLTVDFKQEWFEDDSLKYNHDLARLCSQHITLGYDIGHLKNDLAAIGFEKESIFWETEAHKDQVDNFIAHRPIVVNGEVYTLIFVGCIGTNTIQWLSNFEPGTGETHDSFNKAQEYVYKNLTKYISDNNIDTNKTKILLTGHSRGAATANLLAARLIDEQKFADMNNIYTYTFATPRPTSSDKTDDAKYERIFNIVNPEDFVTKVIPEAWGYKRYGITYTLPSKDNTTKYDKFLDAMQKEYGQIMHEKNKKTGEFTALEYHPFSSGEKETYKVVKNLTDSVTNINQLYDKKFVWLGNRLISVQGFFQETLCKYVAYSEGSREQEEAEQALKDTAFGFDSDKELRALANYFVFHQGAQALVPGGSTGSFGEAHGAPTYTAWMMSLTRSEIMKKRLGYEGTVNCPVDVEIIDKATGEVVGRIVNNVIDEEIAAKENSVVMGVEGDSKSFWLPSDGDFEIRLIGNGEGTMDYTLSTIDSDAGEVERVNFFDVSITDGREMTSEVTSEDFELEEYRLSFENEDTEDLLPSEIMTDGNIIEYSIEVSVEGNGTADNSTTASSGDYVSLTATPAEGSEFVGWFEGSALVSSDMQYSFVVKSNRKLVAKFAETEEPEIKGKVHSVSINDISMSYKDSATVTPSINADSGVNYTVTYSSSNTDVVSVDSNGRLTTNDKGSATITVTVTDEYGNTVSDTCNVEVKYKWWQWIIVIVLFGWIWY